MKRLLAVLMLIWPALAAAGTSYYVDGNCPTAGNGTTIVCGTNGPKKTVHDGIALLSGAGDILNIRGVHNAHDGESGNFDGRYASQAFGSGNDINPKNGSAGNPIIVQSYGWTGNGTGETVYVEGTNSPGTWVQCSGTAGSCNSPCDSATAGSNFPASVLCSSIWNIIPVPPEGGTGMNLASGAERPDGVPTRRETAASAVDTRYESYVPVNTSGARLWVYWGSDNGCTGSGTPWSCCSGSGTGTCNPTETGNAKPYVFYNLTDGFLVRGTSSYVTIRGLTVRDTGETGIQISGSTSNITLQDNKILYVVSNPPGGDTGITIDVSQDVLVDSNEIGWTGSEGVHASPQTGDVATRYTITNNWIHDQGNSTILGPALNGPPAATASGMIISDYGNPTPTGSGNYQGSAIGGNLITDITRYTVGAGISMENHVDNMIVRNNIILRTDGNGIIANSGSGISNNANQIYNNLLVSNCNNGGQGAIEFDAGSINNNLIFNNTIVNPLSGQAAIFLGGTTFTGNIFRNNIIYDAGSKRLVRLDATDATNVFQNNQVYSTSLPGGNTLVTWNGAHVSGGPNYTCAQIGNIAASDICNNPLFTNIPGSDYHIQSTSPAKDAGTATGMPAGRIKDINNTLAALHGLPPYSDNEALFGSAWDIGMDEFSTGVVPSLKISKTHTPDPVIGGNNITYTISYSNAGATQTTGTVISDTIPANTSFVSANAGGTSNGTTVTWSIGVLAGGASGAVQWIAQAATGLSNGTIIQNVCSITSNEQGPVNATADNATVTALPFLTLAMSDQPDPVLAGSNITYTISYANTGTGGATTVVITDVVPVNTTFVSASSGGINSGGTVTWTIGPVNAGVSTSVQLVVAVGAGVAAGSIITNSTYSMSSLELPTVTGAAITTSVITSSPTSTNFVLPITQRQNSWSATQTELAGPNATLVQGPNGAQWIRGQSTEEITLSTSGTTTDSVANLLPANAILEGILARVTTTITVATNWKVGDASQSARFISVQSGLTAGTTAVGLNQADPTVASADLGPVQASAAKVRITTSGTPATGTIRVTVFYRQFIPPGS